MMNVSSGKFFGLFRKLTDEEKQELKPHFKEIAKDFKLILDWYKNKKGETSEEASLSD